MTRGSERRRNIIRPETRAGHYAHLGDGAARRSMRHLRSGVLIKTIFGHSDRVIWLPGAKPDTMVAEHPREQIGKPGFQSPGHRSLYGSRGLVLDRNLSGSAAPLAARIYLPGRG